MVLTGLQEFVKTPGDDLNLAILQGIRWCAKTLQLP